MHLGRRSRLRLDQQHQLLDHIFNMTRIRSFRPRMEKSRSCWPRTGRFPILARGTRASAYLHPNMEFAFPVPKFSFLGFSLFPNLSHLHACGFPSFSSFQDFSHKKGCSRPRAVLTGQWGKSGKG